MMDNRERRDDRIKVEEREQQVKIKKMSGE